MTGRGSVSKLCIHLGMLCAALAFASWWTSHTILNTTRTRRITEAVLESADLRHFVANHIASVTAPAVGVRSSAAATSGGYTNRLDAVLARPDIQVTTNPWAHLVAAVAHAVGAGIVTGLVVLGLVGVVFLFIDYFIPSGAKSAGARAS